MYLKMYAIAAHFLQMLYLTHVKELKLFDPGLVYACVINCLCISGFFSSSAASSGAFGVSGVSSRAFAEDDGGEEAGSSTVRGLQ